MRRRSLSLTAGVLTLEKGEDAVFELTLESFSDHFSCGAPH